jgi:hypothetical protein
MYHLHVLKYTSPHTLHAITFLSALKQTRPIDDVTEEMTFVFLVAWTTRNYNNGAIKITIDTTLRSFPRAFVALQTAARQKKTGTVGM